MFSTFGYYQGRFLISSRLWSDFAAHLPLIRSFSYGSNFPPEYPQFAGEPIRYHYFFYLLTGLLEKAGVNLAFSLNLLSAAGMMGLLGAVYAYAKLFAGEYAGRHKKKPAALAGFFALLLFLFNGSLSFIDYFEQAGWSWQALKQISSLTEFINFGPWSGDIISAFWNWNIYTNQRHLAFSFGLSLWLVWPLVKSSFEKYKLSHFSFWQLFLLWLGLVLLPYFNLAAFGMTAIFIVLWLVLNPKLIKSLGWVYIPGLIYSLPGFWYYWQLGGGELQFQPGFLARSSAMIDILNYWLQNLGLYLILWPLLLVVTRPKIRKWLLIFSVYFVLANTFQLSTDLINNHKLINFFQIGLVIGLAPILSLVWKRKWYFKAAVVLLLIPLTFSGFIEAWPVINDRQVYVEDPVQQDLGSWLQDNIEPDKTVVTTQYLYNPVSLIGRRTYLDYGYFAWSLGYPSRQRRKKLTQIFSPDITQEEWCRLARLEKFDFVLISPGEGDLDLPVDESWLVKNNSAAVEKFQGYKLYAVDQVCFTKNLPI